jgi:tol-pal system protein YbgF
MTQSSHRIRLAALAVLPVLLLAGGAAAQDRSQDRSQPGFLDNLFSRGEGGQQRRDDAPASRDVAQSDPAELTVRLDRLESAIRQLTGTVEQLQYQNQQLQTQLQQLKGGAAPNSGPGAIPGANQAPPQGAPPTARPGNRSDVFDPSQRPNAPGAPRTLGNAGVIAAPEPNTTQNDGPPVGVPGGRDAGAPLDLSTLSGSAQGSQIGSQIGSQPGSQPASQPGPMASVPQGQALPPPPQAPARNVTASGTQLATLPPTASPQDEYDLAYGYVLHKDYALAEQAFRDFLKKYPNERTVPDAQYWLGESLFQRQRYRDAAESFLAVSTKYEKAGKAPDALLRLGQSLAGLNQKEAACATLAEVGRKFPRASATVKRGVTQEQKRAHC